MLTINDVSISSEYAFPIFISSTEYNLKDFRAELARFLLMLGYKPILSSAEGFPDSSPCLEPWESCLNPLEHSFVMVLIVDGRYGEPKSWPNSGELFKDRICSPTHGEYIFAHNRRKRILVFIRKSLMSHYQSYLSALKNCKGDKVKAKALLLQTLPDDVRFEALDFINEIKTTSPIPWIKEFEDITCVKKEIKRKMINELAETFLLKNNHLEAAIKTFNEAMLSLSSEDQKKVLQKVNATKDIIDAVDQRNEYQKQLEETRSELESVEKTKKKNKSFYDGQIVALNKKIADLEAETLKSSSSQFFIKNGQVQYGNPSYIGISDPTSTYYSGDGLYPTLVGQSLFSSQVLSLPKCDSCGRGDSNSSGYGVGLAFSSRTCLNCGKCVCNKCWPYIDTIGVSSLTASSLGDKNKCPLCRFK